MASQSSLPSPPPLADLLVQAPAALFLDFDGTLVELAPEPGLIHIPETLVSSLHDLHDRLEGRLALVSGRALDDLERHLGDVRLYRAGSHGVARRRADGSLVGPEPEGLPPGAVAQLRTFAAAHELLYEEKSHGGALHFRRNPEMGEAVLDFARHVAAQFELEVTTGKAIAELVRPGANKGGAVRAFLTEATFAGACPIFIGDDVTDEDGMAAAIECGGFGIAVGERASKNARYHLGSVTAVHQWLELWK